MTTPLNLADWMARHAVSPAAMAELAMLMVPPIPPMPEGSPSSEGYTQSLIRLEAPRTPGVQLFRNNVGAFEDKTGRWLRYGLANDTPALNDALKSADLIGWRSVIITPEMVGRTIAQFLSRECKRAGWVYTGRDREPAQMAWANLVTLAGGDAAFATGPGTL